MGMCAEAAEVLLLAINPGKRFIEPASILFLASYLRSHDIGVCTDEIRSVEHMLGVLERYRFTGLFPVIGISSMSTDATMLLEAASVTKEKYPGSFIVAGGHGPTLLPEKYLKPGSPIDAVVIGDGEDVLLAVLRCLKNGDEWRTLPGIGYVSAQGVQINEPNRRQRLDLYPPMARDFLERKIHVWGAKDVYASIFSSRGCYKQCSYCSIQSYLKEQPGLPYRLRSASNVVTEMKLIHDRYGISKFAFEDDNFIPPGKAGRARVCEFARALDALDFPVSFMIQTRPDTLTEEHISLLKPLGLKEIQLGVENINAEDLRLYNRDICSEQIEELMNALYLYEYYPTTFNSEHCSRIGYITFHPFVTRESLKQSIAFLRKYGISPKKATVKMKLYEFTPIYKKTKAAGLLQGEDYRFMDPAIDDIYKAFKVFFDCWLPLRSFCRESEKKDYVMTGRVTRAGITNLRVVLDNLAYSFYEDVLNARPASFQAQIDHKLGVALQLLEKHKARAVEAYDFTETKLLRHWR
jgi:radical SAM superfamily enzyme YgiQ (UPF0313 family)